MNVSEFSKLYAQAEEGDSWVSAVSERTYHRLQEPPVLLQLLHRSGPPAAEASIALALKPVLP